MCKFLRNCLQKKFGSKNLCAKIFVNICANFWKKNICANICIKICKKNCANFLWILPPIKNQREATKSQQEANLMGNNSSKPWHKKKMFDTEGESSGELDNRAANYDEENLVAEKNKKRSNRDRKEPKNLVSKSSRSNEVNPEFNIDQKEELSYVQNNQLGAFLSDDFIPAAWQSFNLDHKHLLDLALNRI